MNILTVDDINNKELLELFLDAEHCRHMMGKNSFIQSYTRNILATLFFEPSTRTRLSFESAIARLGGTPISAPDANNLSIVKGESLADTIKNVAFYADVIVIRAPYAYQTWDVRCRSAVINAGDGQYNHPTQAFLDAYTIWRQYGASTEWPFIMDSFVHGIVGDLSKSRTIRSYLQLMTRQSNHTFYLLDSTGIDGRVLDLQRYPNVHYLKKGEFEKKLPELDVLYLNRVQTERWVEPETAWANPDKRVFEPEFVLSNNEHLHKMKRFCMVMNPGPRKEELPDSVIHDPRVKMWEQAENGLYLRMALLRKVMD